MTPLGPPRAERDSSARRHHATAENYNFAHIVVTTTRHSVRSTAHKISPGGEFHERNEDTRLAQHPTTALLSVQIPPHRGLDASGRLPGTRARCLHGKLRVQRIARDIHGNARAARKVRPCKRTEGSAGEQRAIRGKAEIVDACNRTQHFEKGKNIASRERFPAGNPDFGHAQFRGEANQPQCFFITKNVFARQPFLQFTRHAIGAALIAAICDRYPQIGNAMPESILHCSATLRSTRCSIKEVDRLTRSEEALLFLL